MHVSDVWMSLARFGLPAGPHHARPNFSPLCSACRDTRGITSSNYLRGEIRCILEGVFPEKGLDIEQVRMSICSSVIQASSSSRAVCFVAVYLTTHAHTPTGLIDQWSRL